MQSFLDALRTQRCDDHRYYHHSRINQTLHLVSALSFLTAYVFIMSRDSLESCATRSFALFSLSVCDDRGLDRVSFSAITDFRMSGGAYAEIRMN